MFLLSWILGARALLLFHDLFNVVACHSAGEAVLNVHAGDGSEQSKCAATFVPADL